MLLELLPPAVVGRRTIEVQISNLSRRETSRGPVYLHSELQTPPADGIHCVFPICVGAVVLERDQR